MDLKHCARCGRVITPRKRWAKNWAQIKYCSKACRSQRLREVDEALEAAIQSLLAARGSTKSICPSEAARMVGGQHWRPLMQAARMAARRLVQKGAVEITQGGQVVDPSTAKGPIRVRVATPTAVCGGSGNGRRAS